MDIPTLTECRGADDYAQAIVQIDARLKDLDTEAAGQPFGDEARAEFAELQTVRKEAFTAKDELEARAAYITSLSDKPQNAAQPTRHDRPELRRTPEDIYDLAAYRGRVNSEPQLHQALRDGAMRAVDKIRFDVPNVDQSRAKEGVQTLLDRELERGDGSGFARQFIETDSPKYKRAYEKYLRLGPQSLTGDETRGTALAMEVVGTGGYLVPPAFDPTLIHVGAWTAINPIRATARNIQLVAGQNTWHGITSSVVVATRADEAAAATEQGPAFLQPTITPTRVHGQITFSFETGQDRPDLPQEMAGLIYEAKDNEEETIFSTGAGGALGSLTVPTGISPAHATSGAFDHIACAADGTFAIADLDSVFAAVPLRNRSRAVWFLSRPILGTVQGFETTGGRLFGSQAGYPAVGQVGSTPSNGDTGLRLLGRPVMEHPSGAASAVDGANKYLLALLDMSQYGIVDRVGMTVEYLPYVFAAGGGRLATGERALYFYWRNSAKPINTAGGCLLYHQA